MSFGRLGALGRGFGRLGGLLGSPGGSPAPANTLVAGAGSFLLSGESMTPLVDYRLPSDVGAFSEAGQDAGLLRGYLTSAAVGAFTLAGQNVTLTKSSSTPFGITKTDNAEDNTGQTTYTWSSRNFAIGTADSTRLVVVAIGSRGGAATPTVSSVTIGGVSATAVVEGRNVIASTSVDLISLWQAAVPSGTTATVSATFSGAMVRAGCIVFSVLGSNGVAPSGGAVAHDDTNNDSTGTITVPSGGGSIIGGVNNTGTANVIGTTNWTADTAVTPAILIGSSLQYVAGHDTSHSGSTAYTIVWNAGTQDAGAFAAWSP